jgi:ABC-type nitrate/sulfonate/bicarbonate transport system substrate-binding protein
MKTNTSIAKLVALVTLIATIITSPAMALEGFGKLTVIHIPQSAWTIVAAKKGWLQEAYAKYNLKVDLVDPGTSVTAGQEAALLANGELHFASRMSYPALIHKTNGIDASIVWLASESDGNRTPIIVLRDSPLESITDLKGKVFSSSRVGCGWSAPTEALNHAGLTLDTDLKKGDVQYVNSNNTTSALLGGKIDATATHIALVGWSNLVIQGVVKVIGRTTAGGPYETAAGRPAYFAMRKFAEQHPELVKVFLETRVKTAKWVQAHPDEAASIVAQDSRIPKYVAKFQIQDPSAFEFIGSEPNYGNAVAAFEKFQAYYKQNGDDILAHQSLSNQEIEQFIDRRFFEGGQYSIYN